MKKDNLKLQIKSIRKDIQANITSTIKADIGKIAGQYNGETTKLDKEIKKAAKKLSKEIKISKAALRKNDGQDAKASKKEKAATATNEQNAS
jgi:hypothetical protein